MAEVYVADSKLCGRLLGTNLGKGLHTLNDLLPGALVGEFHGSIITVGEYALRDSRGEGGYGIALRGRDGFILDCYAQVKRGECLMSYANTARHTYKVTRGPGFIKVVDNRNNCEARQDGDRVRLYVGRHKVKAHSELFWAYGCHYNV